MATDFCIGPDERFNSGDREAGERLRNEALISLAPEKTNENKPADEPSKAPIDKKQTDSETALTAEKSAEGAADNPDQAAESEPKQDNFISVFADESFGTEKKPEIVKLGDGRTRQDNPDGSSLEFDANKQLTKINYADGSARELKWNGTILTHMKSRTNDLFTRLFSQGQYYDRWTKKDNTFWDGNIKVISESGDYISKPTGQTDQQVMKANGCVDVLHTDKSKDSQFPSGSTAKFDSADNLVGMKTADGRAATLTWEEQKQKDASDQLTGNAVWILTKATITSGGQISAWQLKNGKWQKDGKDTDSQLKADSKSGQLTILNAQGNNEVWHQSGMLEVKAKDGATTISQKNADGSFTKIGLKEVSGKAEITSVAITKNNITDVWERQESPDNKTYSDNWKNKSNGALETRTEVSLSSLGTLSFKTSDGAKYALTADGKESLVNRNPDWSVFYDKGHVSRVNFRDGVSRLFTWDGDTIATVTVQRPDSTTVWTKIGPDKYKAGNDEYAARLSINKNGDYSFTELGSETIETIRRPNGVEITKNKTTKTETERDSGRVTRLSINNNERLYQRDTEGKLESIVDPARNTVWKRDQNDLWSAEARDSAKPFTAPEKTKRQGSGEPTDDGVSVFVSDDNVLIQDNIDGTTQKFEAAKDLVKRIENNTDLDNEQRYKFLLNIAAFEARPVDKKERADSYKEITRMLDDTSTTAFNPKDRAVLAGQCLWLMANPHRSEQGLHNTCNVTTIRNCILREEPSQFARLIADVSTTGKFVAFDKTEIKPHDFSLKAGAEELQNPLPAGARTWASQIWDITTANIYWQRATSDPLGNAVTKGSIYYDQVTPRSRGDSIERLYRYDNNGTVFEVPSPDGQVTRHPYLIANSMIDIFEQLNGKVQKDRIILHSAMGSGKGIATVSSANDLNNVLANGSLPKIIQIHTSRQPFFADSGHGSAGGAGGATGDWHVVTITDYDKTAKKIQFDNSWSPTVDHLNAAKAVPVQQMYDATIGRYTAAQQGQQPETRTVEILKPRRRADLSDQKQNFISRTVPDGTKSKREIIHGLEIINQGNVDSMLLPDGWMPKKRNNAQFSLQRVDQFQLPKYDGALNFFYRGAPISKEDGGAFKEVLAANPHNLSDAELMTLGQPLGSLADKQAFEIKKAETVDLNGKRVLQVEGQWKSGGKKFHGLLLNAGGDGTIIQEIFYEADSQAFDAHIDKIKSSLGTIRWK